MNTDRDVVRLDETLNKIATLYQFRSLNKPLYSNLTVSQSYCLRILYFRGTRTMSELAAELNVRLSTVTGIIDQLEDKKLVERIDHPEDRRSLHVRLTSPGKALYRAAHETFLSHIAPLLISRSKADREKLLGFLDEVMTAIRAWRSDRGKKRAKR
jgi:DNA-binding MarR family transcriptional regulator